VRPSLYLAGFQARTFHGPGRKLCAMALPRRWEHGDGRVAVAAPFEDDLRAVQATGDLAAYRAACERRWQTFAELGRFERDRFRCVVHADPGPRPTQSPVVDGDTLFCACAAPDSPRWKHPCHLEILAPFLVRAGWDVVLWGRRIEWTCPDVFYSPESERAVYADTGETYDPATYGWPNAETTT